jgi:hypothetical protein
VIPALHPDVRPAIEVRITCGDRPTFIGAAISAIQTEIVRHTDEQEKKQRKAG